MHWIITHDHVSKSINGEHKIGMLVVDNKRVQNGPQYNYVIERLKYSFRLYDDDDVLYYEGQADDEDFGPLNWAMADVGCTRIDYRQPDGSWATL